AFALLTLRPGFARLWDQPGQRLLQALHCWTWSNLFFCTISPEHAPRHSFPLFPGIAGLAAMVWWAWLTGKYRWPITTSHAHSSGSRIQTMTDMALRLAARPSWVLVGMLAFWLLAKVVFVELVIPERNFSREPRAKGERLAALVAPDKTVYLSG